MEVFGQPVPVIQQASVRHMDVEARLLRGGGPGLRTRIRELKRSGLKTEPAFAMVLGLKGDPYQSLLDLADWEDSALERLVADALARRA